jgi:hypothetical protein
MLRSVGKALKRALQHVQLFLMGKEFRHQVTCYERYRTTAEQYTDRFYNVPEVLQVLGNLDAIVHGRNYTDLAWAVPPRKRHPVMNIFELYGFVYKLRKLRHSEAMGIYSGWDQATLNTFADIAEKLRCDPEIRAVLEKEVDNISLAPGRFMIGRYGHGRFGGKNFE